MFRIAILLMLFNPSLQQGLQQPLINSLADNLIAQVNLASSHQMFQLPASGAATPLDIVDLNLGEGNLHLSNLSRVGDVKLDTHQPGVVRAQLFLHIGNLKAVFKKYTIKAIALKFNDGHFVATQKDNTVRIQIKFTESICNMEVEKVMVMQKRFDVEIISQKNILASLSDLIFNQILNLFNDLIKDPMQKRIVKFIHLSAEDFQSQCRQQTPNQIKSSEIKQRHADDSQY